ncbi:MAG: hypothetical protein JEY97_06555 [Bacteroidales bacterium]|nr:hypothetical protein [Bacteroidales bacterium]
MRFFFRIIFVFTNVLITNSLLFSQNDFSDNIFINYNVSNGLSNNTVFEVVQDKYGFIWISTEDGLNRFDGYDFEIFRNNPSDSSSIGGNYHKYGLKIEENNDIGLFVNNSLIKLYFYNHQNGFCPWKKYLDFTELKLYDTLLNKRLRNLKFKYNKELKRVIILENKKDSEIILSSFSTKSLEKSISKLWFSYDSCLLCFDKISKTIRNYMIYNKAVLSVVKYDKYYVWFISDNKLIKYNICDNSYKILLSNIFNSKYFFVDKFAKIWLNKLDANKSYDLAIIDNNDSVKIVKIDSLEKNNDFHFIYFTEIEGNVWVSTSTMGVIIFDIHGNKLDHIQQQPNRRESFKGVSTRRIYEDKNKNIWITTEQNGINFYSKNKNRFKNFSKSNSSTHQLSGNFIRGMCFDEFTGDIWAGTRDGGLVQIDIKENKTKFHLNNFTENELIIESVLPDTDSTLWIGSFHKGSYNGIFRYNHYTQKLDSFYNKKIKNYDLYVRDIFIDKDKNTWFCAMGGLIKYSDNKTIETFLLGNKNDITDESLIFDIIQSKNGNYFLGTEGGVLMIDENANILKSYKHKSGEKNTISCKTVFCVFEDSNEILWAGTFGGGLNKINTKTNEIKIYTTSNGLCNDAVFGILEDKMGNLWLSTNNGLSCFNPENETFRNFSTKDGLVYDAFSFGAYCKDNKGNMYFGTQEGISMFNPDSLLKTDSINELVISEFHIHGTNRKYAFPDTNKCIEISYLTENLFSIDFVSPEFSDQEKIHYSYRIDPLHDEWIDLGKQRNIVFSNLPHGKYKIRLKSTKIPDEWNSSTTHIPVFIKPPFWATLIFKIAVFFIIVSILLAILWNRHRNAKRVKAIRTKLAHDLHDEIGSNISSIHLIGQKMSGKSFNDEKAKKVGNDILVLSNRTVESIRDIIWFMKPENDSPKKIKTRLTDYIVRTHNDIEYKIKLDDEFFRKDIPSEILNNSYLIIKELVNNVAKHSKANYTEIILTKTGSTVKIVVKDNGCGMLKKPKGTGMESIKKRVNDMNGELLINTSSEKGTEVIININL